ncbi:MAG: methyltransferase domain-containing protein [Nitrospirota bacterium]
MKYSSLDLLCCPHCRQPLSLESKKENGIIHEGTLRCTGCDQAYPVHTGIARFTTSSRLSGPNREFAKAYDRISHIYDSVLAKAYLSRHFWPSRGEEKARGEVIERLELADRRRVLETGIGTGDNIPHIFRRGQGIKVYGVDISGGMLRQCAKNLKKWGCDAELFLGNAEKLPFRDESFEAVFHVGGVNFFTDRRKAIEEMIRVARAGTRIVIVCETEKAIIHNRVGIRLAFGRHLADLMSTFRFQEMPELVPGTMREIHFEQIWECNGYLLEFRKP